MSETSAKAKDDAYAVLSARLKAVGLGDARPAMYRLDEPERTAVAEEAAWAKLKLLVAKGATGWCATTDAVVRLTNEPGLETDFEALKAQGHLTDAEVCHGDTSTHIRHVSGASAWWMTQVTAHPATAGDATHWMTVVKRRGIDPETSKVGEPRVLSYQAFWKIDLPVDAATPPQIEPDALRFIALQPMPKKEH